MTKAVYRRKGIFGVYSSKVHDHYGGDHGNKAAGRHGMVLELYHETYP